MSRLYPYCQVRSIAVMVWFVSMFKFYCGLPVLTLSRERSLSSHSHHEPPEVDLLEVSVLMSSCLIVVRQEQLARTSLRPWLKSLICLKALVWSSTVCAHVCKTLFHPEFVT